MRGRCSSLTIVTGSFLLFLTQPMIARMALPRVGGAPAVWNSAMLVYQAAAARRLRLCPLALAAAAAPPGRHPSRPASALAALWLPIGLTDAVPPADGAAGLLGALVPDQLDRAALLHRLGPGAADAALVRARDAAAAIPIRSTPPPISAASPACISYPLLVEPLMTPAAAELAVDRRSTPCSSCSSRSAR